jgi:hypothetical protein
MTAPATLAPSFSFYVPGGSKSASKIVRAASFGDAVTVAGPNGPETVRQLREAGFSRPVLFDGTGYSGHEFDCWKWLELQRAAGADRLMTPGVFVPWDKNNADVLRSAIADHVAVARAFDATVIAALDSRWIAKLSRHVADVLLSSAVPVALVLCHRADPLDTREAVEGLRFLAASVPQLSVLRCDHGGLAVPAFGGAHVAFGLTTTHRHFAHSGMRPSKAPGNSPRLFVRSLLDWFRASEIAGWLAAGPILSCGLPCCAGGSLADYLDPLTDRDAVSHNMMTLASFAEYVLGAEDDASQIFVDECRRAVANYHPSSFRGPENPKAQLTSWVLL